MLIAVIPVKDDVNLIEQINSIHYQIDGIELRLDYASTLDFNIIAAIRYTYTLPMIFTLRKKSQGGFYPFDEAKRLQDILMLCQLQPEYLDLEYDISTEFLKMIKLQYPNIKIICSYHHFNETPTDLLALLQSLQYSCFDIYKIATYANKTSEALRMLQFVKTFRHQYALIGICMGEHGQCTRILSPIVGNIMNYASVNHSQITANGQLTVDELVTTYHYHQLNQASTIYALLGDPITHSVGHILHNQAIQLLQKNAVYIKLRVTPDDLPNIMKQCRLLPFVGFSITMPLKELIIPLLDVIDQSSQPIQAINSIKMTNGKWVGFNTDGTGAMQALNAQKIKMAEQTIVILGAGGAARAIAHAALTYQAKVIILNRSLAKAKQLAAIFSCEGDRLHNGAGLKKIKYTILINTLPNSAYTSPHRPLLLSTNDLLPHTRVFDIVSLPINTPLLQAASKKNCICIYGYNMYIYQALLQIKDWFQPNNKQLNKIKKVMRHYFLKLRTCTK